MKPAALSLLAAFAFVAHGAFASPPPGYTLHWSDEFSGTRLDATKWKHWLPGRRRDATNVPEAVTLRDGFLTITTYTERGAHFTGMISTDGIFGARFGYLEARIKWSDSPGMWSAFWCQTPTMGNPKGDVAAAGAEIDIAEHRAVDEQGKNIAPTVNFGLHWDGYGKDHKNKGHASQDWKLNEGFHTYGFEWTESSYTISIDGKTAWTVNEPISKRAEFIVLSSEVDDKAWATHIPAQGYGDRPTSRTKLVVDYVRYYTKP